MSRTGEFILIFAVVFGVGLYAVNNISCWHIPYVSVCSVK